MTTVILLTVLWILTVVLAFITGRYSLREEMKQGMQNQGDNYYSEGTGVEGPPGPVGAMGPMGPEGPPGPPGESAASEEWVMDIATRLKTLEDRDAAYNDRFRRVERKAGMSV